MTSLSLAELGDCILEGWRPAIGDPHLMGWLTVLAYLTTGCAAFAALRREASARPRLFWSVTAALMLFLAVNKQLDLQSALTQAGRCIAIADSWYGERRGVQLRFILGLVVAAALFLALGLWLLRRQLGRCWLALVGLALVACFVLVRAVGFHGFDAFLGRTLHSVRMNWLLEWSGLVLITANALWLVRGRAQQRLPTAGRGLPQITPFRAGRGRRSAGRSPPPPPPSPDS